MRKVDGYVCVLLLACAGLAPAQRVTSDILGVVTDGADAGVANAKITVTQRSTGLEWSAVSEAMGAYRVQGLPPGTYEVRAEHTGFNAANVKNIEVEVNQQAVVNLRLTVGELATFVVESRASMLDSVNGHLSGMVSTATLSELPLNGRDLSQLILLQPGTYPTTNAGPNPWSDGGYTKAAVQGARPTMNNINLDGGDINDPAYNVPPGGVSGVQMGLEGTLEYRVLLNSYSAEFGRNAGANVQLVTKSGDNNFHGSVYEYLRNAALDARNFFDTAGVPPFIRNQFGLSAGGPIKRNRAFFFANYEGLRERKSVTDSITVPDANAHRGLLPSATDPAKLVNVGVDPKIAPLLALYPMPNGASIGAGLATLNTSGRQPTRADYGVMRVDWRAGPKDDLFVRYVADDSDSTVPFLSTLVPGFPGHRTTRNQYLMTSWLRRITPRLMNEVKLSYDRPNYLAQAANQIPISISLLPNRAFGNINISGLPALGNNIGFPFGGTSNVYEAIDNVAYERGAHLLKAGVNAKRMQITGPIDVFTGGAYVFTDLTPFGLPAASGNPALEFFMHAVPIVYIGVDPAASNSTRGFRQTYFAGYVQDEYRARPNLSLTFGLRWEYWSMPSEQYGRIANIRNLATDAKPTVGQLWNSVPLDLWSPRLGLAWTPDQSQKTVVRAAAGVMRDQIWSNLYGDVRFYEPFYRPLEYILPNFLTPPSGVNSLVGFGGPPQVIGSFGITYQPSFPYYLEYTVNVQRQLASDLMLQVAYAGSRGIHLLRSGEANPFVASLGRRINPNFGSIPAEATDGQSVYNSGQVSLRKRLSHGLLAEAAYTYSRSIDDASGVFPSDFSSESGVAQDFFNRKAERGRSAFDRKHVFTASYLWELPVHPRGAALKAIAGGWMAGGILTLDTGVPFTANLGSFNNSGNQESNAGDRPSVKPGASACTGSGTVDRWFDASIFTLPAPGQYGNAGRNIMCGPPLKNFDFSLRKEFRLRERARVEFRAEFFNLFNHASFDVPLNTQGPNGSGGNGDAIYIGRQSVLSNGQACTAANDPSGAGCGVLAPNVGRIFRTVTTSRQIQFALKLKF